VICGHNTLSPEVILLHSEVIILHPEVILLHPEVILLHHFAPPVTRHTVQRGSCQQQQAPCVGMQPQPACKEGQDEQFAWQNRQAVLLSNPQQHVSHHIPQLYICLNGCMRWYWQRRRRKLAEGLQCGMARSTGSCYTEFSFLLLCDHLSSCEVCPLCKSVMHGCLQCGHLYMHDRVCKIQHCTAAMLAGSSRCTKLGWLSTPKGQGGYTSWVYTTSCHTGSNKTAY
jgi:hypothetical protein